MSLFARLVPNEELQKYEDLFSSSTFMKLLDGLDFNLLENINNSDIVKITYLPIEPEDYTVTEIKKLLDFGDKAQAILTYYEANTNDETDAAEVFQIWKQEEDHVVFKEYVNGNLYNESIEEELYEVYKHHLKIPKLTEKEELEKLSVQPFYNPLSCIQNGSCCYFEKQRYEHCGKYCGIYEDAGGGTAINSFDSCCRTHDIQIRGKKGKDRCPAHKNFMSCTKGLSAPGAKTMRGGIRVDALANGCGIV